MSILEEADNLVNGERLETYEGTDDTIVALWAGYLGVPLTVLDYANLMILMKVARTKGKFHRDSYVDIAGYAEVGPRLWLAAKTEDMEQEFDYLADLERRLTQPEFPWVIYLEDVPDDDQFFYDHMSAPVQPRVWQLLTEVPVGLLVTDPEGISWVGEGPDGDTHYDKYGPFTEVIGNE